MTNPYLCRNQRVVDTMHSDLHRARAAAFET